MKFMISSGHGLYVRGASHPNGLDEVDEARRVVPELAHWLKLYGHDVMTFNDDTSTTQDQNLHTIVDAHNSAGPHDWDISVHFNAYTWTEGGRGVEVCYVSQGEAAAAVSQAIAETGGLINRGAKYRSDLYFLNKTREKALLLEICFVDAAADVAAYDTNFEAICRAIATVAPSPERFDRSVMHIKGRVSWFGGPEDVGMSPSEGLALEAEGVNPENKPHLFLDEQPPNTTGNARRLNADGANYIACRWNYEQFPKRRLAGDELALVRSPKTGAQVTAHPVDWGPHEQETGRAADVSPKVLSDLGLETDDEVEIIYPFQKKSA